MADAMIGQTLVLVACWLSTSSLKLAYSHTRMHVQYRGRTFEPYWHKLHLCLLPGPRPRCFVWCCEPSSRAQCHPEPNCLQVTPWKKLAVYRSSVSKRIEIHFWEASSIHTEQECFPEVLLSKSEIFSGPGSGNT